MTEPSIGTLQRNRETLFSGQECHAIASKANVVHRGPRDSASLTDSAYGAFRTLFSRHVGQLRQQQITMEQYK